MDMGNNIGMDTDIDTAMGMDNNMAQEGVACRGVA
jgi:hypothetical protein